MCNGIFSEGKGDIGWVVSCFVDLGTWWDHMAGKLAAGLGQVEMDLIAG